MPRPTFARVSHTSFSVPDCEASAQWWTDVFGFTEIDRVEDDTWRAVILLHPASATVIEFQQHDANAGERFDPTRTGLDHMGLKVDDPADLVPWQEHFERLGVTHTPIVEREYGSILTFKDPNGIQFELFYRDGHP